MHCDAVPCTGIAKAWCKMVDLFSWGSLLATDGETMQTICLMFGIHLML